MRSHVSKPRTMNETVGRFLELLHQDWCELRYNIALIGFMRFLSILGLLCLPTSVSILTYMGTKSSPPKNNVMSAQELLALTITQTDSCLCFSFPPVSKTFLTYDSPYTSIPSAFLTRSSLPFSLKTRL